MVGLSCAYHLAKNGWAVIVLERERVGAGASWGNAGTVSVGHPPLNSPGRIGKSLGSVLRRRSPLYVKARWDPPLWRWFFEFARRCSAEHVARYMEVMGPLGHLARASFRDLVAAVAVDCGYAEAGYFDVCATGAGLRDVREESELMKRWRYRPELLTAGELRGIEPAFGPGVVGGAFYPEACTLDPALFLGGLERTCARLGAEVRVGPEVREIVSRGGSVVGVRTTTAEELGADAVVLATGPFSLRLVRQFGCRVPVEPGKGYHRDLPKAGLRLACVLHETSVFCTPMEGRLRLAGTMEFSGENHVLRRARLEQLSNSAARYLPGLRDLQASSEWCGLRPMTADGLPVVGPVPRVSGLYLATGHGMLGLTLGPITGEIVAGLMTDGTARGGKPTSQKPDGAGSSVRPGSKRPLELSSLVHRLGPARFDAGRL